MEARREELPIQTPEVDSPVKTSHAVQIFALVIGINSYLQRDTGSERVSASFPVLRGCVEDANDMIDFLEGTLGVPIDRITTLYDEDATQRKIIDAFKSLASDTRIPKGASIIIFYAGHGGEIQSDISGETIQMLIPHDFRMDSSDAGPTATNGLEDYKIGELLTKIANSKGNNITVILDCCHSGSGTRNSEGTQDDLGTPRRIKLPEGARLAKSASRVFAASATTRGAAIREEDKNRFLGSHVVIAACHPKELAYERDGRGAFTRALTTLLRSGDLSQLTYSDVVKKLPDLHEQTPQCEGVNKNRIFLHDKVSGPQRTRHRVTTKDDGTYELDAGEAHGVLRDAEFAIQKNNACMEELGRLTVSDVQPLTSTLTFIEGKLPFKVPEPCAFAFQTRIGAGGGDRLLVELDSNLAHVVANIQHEMLRNHPTQPFFRVASSPEDRADLIITARQPEGTTALFKITDPYCNKAGLCEIPHHPPTDEQSLSRVLRGAALFYWHLHPRSERVGVIAPKVTVECYELIDDEEMRITGNNLCQGGVIRIPFNGQRKPYGFWLHNGYNKDLFVSVFCFNMSDLSINAFYEPPDTADGHHLPTLKSNGSLTIGYGTGGATPQTFYLAEGQDVDVAYLKIFLSVRYVNYGMLPQKSPFLMAGRSSMYFVPPMLMWDTIVIPIVQAREAVWC